MRERQLLQCIQDVAIMQYYKTGDKWWGELAAAAEEKEKEGNKWWRK